MPSSFDFIQDPGYQQHTLPQPNLNNMRPVPAPAIREPQPDNVTVGGAKFTIIGEDTSRPVKKLTLADPEVTDLVPTRHSTPKKKKEVDTVDRGEIIKSDGTIEEMPTMYSYAETTNMTRQTIAQLDMLASELKSELDSVRNSRTLKRKYDYISGISSTLSNLIGTKLTAIREINNSISKSNEMDYKKDKDRRAQEGVQNDDKYIMDLYNAFIMNPANNPNNNQVLGPSAINSMLSTSGIVRADPTVEAAVSTGGVADAGFLNYMSNMTPEQRLMYLEQDPNVKQVVVFDASTGNKFFQVMNVTTGQVVPGVPVRDQMFMEDTTIDLRNKIAKNLNLNETYPVIVINEGVTSEY